MIVPIVCATQVFYTGFCKMKLLTFAALCGVIAYAIADTTGKAFDVVFTSYCSDMKICRQVHLCPEGTVH